jgi:ATP-binding cassette, subfamily B, bacterial MsbA
MKKRIKEYLRLLGFARNYIWALVAAAFCMGASTIFEGVSFGALAPILDRVFAQKEIVIPGQVNPFITSVIDRLNAIEPREFVNFLIIFVPLLFIFKGIFLFFQDYLMNVVGQGVVREVRNNLYAKFQELSMDFYGKSRTGELMSRVTNDVAIITNAISYALKDLIFESMKVVFFAVGALWLGFHISWQLLLVIFIIFPAIMIPVVKVGKKVRKFTSRIQERMADLNSHMAETIAGAHIVKAFCREQYEIDRFKRTNQDHYRFSLKTVKRTLALAPLTEIVGVCGIMFIVYMIAPDVISGKVSFGVFAVFVTFIGNMIRPMKKLSNVHAINQKALAAAERIYEILDQKPQVKENPKPVLISNLEKAIEFQGISFFYNEDDGWVLEDINLDVQKGQTIAFVGTSGAGKSTLVGLLPRFYDPQKGRVVIDGIDIRSVSLHSLRSLIAIVSQETVLFNASVRDNIAYGRAQATFEDVIDAAKKAHAYEFIEKTPDGFNTMLGDRGFRLSGGEKQRIAIARAILKNAPILILDEATSNLDTASEQLIKEALGTLIEGKTAFIIAHRLSTVQQADKIVVLEKGRIVEVGSHKELFEKNAVYRRLHDLQFNV